MELDKDKLYNYWKESSEKDFKTMNDLLETCNFNWSLFIRHLVSEKLPKAYFVKKKNEFPLLIHDLRRIAEKSDLELNDELIIDLDTISRFNISARYDTYKQSFYEQCNKEFTLIWIKKINSIREWIKLEL